MTRKDQKTSLKNLLGEMLQSQWRCPPTGASLIIFSMYAIYQDLLKKTKLPIRQFRSQINAEWHSGLAMALPTIKFTKFI